MDDKYYILQGLIRLRKEYISVRDKAFVNHHTEVYNDYQKDIERVNEIIEKVRKGK